MLLPGRMDKNCMSKGTRSVGAVSNQTRDETLMSSSNDVLTKGAEPPVHEIRPGWQVTKLG